PLCRNVTDTALMLEAIAGYDPLEATSVDWDIEQYTSTLNAGTDRFRIGLPYRLFFEDLESDIEKTVYEAIDVIRKMSADVRDVELPDAPTTVLGPEAYAVHAQYFTSSPDLYQRWTRERLSVAGSVSTVAYVEGRHELERVRRAVNSIFSTVDLLVTPT